MSSASLTKKEYRMEIDLCSICHETEADIDDYGLLICNPCLDTRPDLKAGLDRAFRNDPVEWDHE